MLSIILISDKYDYFMHLISISNYKTWLFIQTQMLIDRETISINMTYVQASQVENTILTFRKHLFILVTSELRRRWTFVNIFSDGLDSLQVTVKKLISFLNIFRP